MITLVSNTSTADLEHAEKIANLDPFQLAPPLWKDKSFLALLPESEFVPPINAPKSKGKTKMGIQMVAIAEAPKRIISRGSPIPEVTEVMTALKGKDFKSATSAIKVTLSPATITRLGLNKKKQAQNPARALAAALKRNFVNGGLDFTAYSPDGKDVIVIKQKEAK